ncbi:hypothetical protein PIB30_104093, partial [Stylosanthes scabra]|nr:hypothetical protein [Stylosanthes scabra]
GYGWSISAWPLWNSRGTPEAQSLAEVSHAFSGRSLTWFQLWSHWNPHADWDTFDLAFLHQFKLAMRPLLPKICWNKVEGEAKTLQSARDITDQDPIPNTAEQQLITYQKQDEENEAELDEPDSGDGASSFKATSASEWSELAKEVVVQRPPPEPPDLNAEDSAIMKRKVEPPDLEATNVDARCRSLDRSCGRDS